MELINNPITTNRKSKMVAAAIVLLVAGNILFGVQYFLQAAETKKLQGQLESQKTKEQAVLFLNLFVQKVLKTDKEVSFEDRLKLENAIRDINDPVLLQKWEAFTGGTNEFEIQKGVKDLLEALAKKIS